MSWTAATARASLPDFTDSGPSPSDVSAAVSAANSAITSAQQAYAADLAKAKDYVATANGYADAASRACDQMP